MGLLDRWRRGASGSGAQATGRTAARAARGEAEAHLAAFAQSRTGVEGYVEPRTNVTEQTLVLVAADGEWTRRRVPDARAAFALGRDLGIPVYDVAATGYPSRMREWTARKRAEERARGQA